MNALCCPLLPFDSVSCQLFLLVILIPFGKMLCPLLHLCDPLVPFTVVPFGILLCSFVPFGALCSLDPFGVLGFLLNHFRNNVRHACALSCFCFKTCLNNFESFPNGDDRSNAVWFLIIYNSYQCFRIFGFPKFFKIWNHQLPMVFMNAVLFLITSNIPKLSHFVRLQRFAHFEVHVKNLFCYIQS